MPGKKLTGWNEQDFEIFVYLGAGVTQEKTADALSLSRTTIANRKAENPRFFEYVYGLVKRVLSASIDHQVEITTANYKSKLEKLLPKAHQALDRALDADDVRVAADVGKYVSDHAIGRATQKIETQGTVDHNVRVIPSGLAQALISEIQRLQGSRALPPANVIDVEPAN